MRWARRETPPHFRCCCGCGRTPASGCGWQRTGLSLGWRKQSLIGRHDWRTTRSVFASFIAKRARVAMGWVVLAATGCRGPYPLDCVDLLPPEEATFVQVRALVV